MISGTGRVFQPPSGFLPARSLGAVGLGVASGGVVFSGTAEVEVVVAV